MICSFEFIQFTRFVINVQISECMKCSLFFPSIATVILLYLFWISKHEIWNSIFSSIDKILQFARTIIIYWKTWNTVSSKPQISKVRHLRPYRHALMKLVTLQKLTFYVYLPRNQKWIICLKFVVCKRLYIMSYGKSSWWASYNDDTHLLFDFRQRSTWYFVFFQTSRHELLKLMYHTLTGCVSQTHFSYVSLRTSQYCLSLTVSHTYIYASTYTSTYTHN